MQDRVGVAAALQARVGDRARAARQVRVADDRQAHGGRATLARELRRRGDGLHAHGLWRRASRAAGAISGHSQRGLSVFAQARRRVRRMTSTALPLLPSRAPVHPAPVRLDIVVPVYNEQAVLARSIRRLHDHLADTMPFELADRHRRQREHRRHGEHRRRARRRLPGVTPARARPRVAPRAARGVAGQRGGGRRYMDVDLSTDLRALLPLVAPLVSGRSDIAIGTRFHRGCRSCAARVASSSRACKGFWRSARASATRSAASKRCGPAPRGGCCRPSATTRGSSTRSC